MRPLIPALLLSATVPAICQTSQRPFQFQVPPQQSPHIWTQPRVFPFDKNVPAPGFALQVPEPQFSNPGLDEHIIRRPPKDSFSQQQPRTPLAGNLYPGLKLLPIETARMEPIPVYFPKPKWQPIPRTSPEARMVPLHSGTNNPDRKK